MRDGHERLRSSLAAYVLGELSAPGDAAVERHLVHCAGCAIDADRLVQAAYAILLLPREGIRRLVDEPFAW